jgi:hypothetical protein
MIVVFVYSVLWNNGFCCCVGCTLAYNLPFKVDIWRNLILLLEGIKNWYLFSSIKRMDSMTKHSGLEMWLSTELQIRKHPPHTPHRGFLLHGTPELLARFVTRFTARRQTMSQSYLIKAEIINSFLSFIFILSTSARKNIIHFFSHSTLNSFIYLTRRRGMYRKKTFNTGIVYFTSFRPTALIRSVGHLGRVWDRVRTEKRLGCCYVFIIWVSWSNLDYIFWTHMLYTERKNEATK